MQLQTLAGWGDGTGTPPLRPCLLKPKLHCLQELWRLSYPLHTKNTVPAWAVPVLSTCGPALVRHARCLELTLIQPQSTCSGEPGMTCSSVTGSKG